MICQNKTSSLVWLKQTLAHRGTFTRVLGHYSRDLGLFSLHTAVSKMTSIPCDVFGLQDRGILAKNKFADLVLFDPDTVIDKATYEKSTEASEGIVLVVVNGRVAWKDGKQVGRNGRRLNRIGQIQQQTVRADL